MLTPYLILSTFVFAFIAWRNFNLALAMLFALLPTYLIRFNIGPLPTTLLEVMVLIIVAIVIARTIKNKDTRNKIQTNLKSQILNNKLLFAAILLFLAGAAISIFTSLNLRSALGEWKAFYVEPILLFLVLISTMNKGQGTSYKLQETSYILFALILSGLLTSILAIYQHFTGWGVPSAFWENGGSYRVTAWYGFPNAVGLFLAPSIPLALYVVIQNWKHIQQKKVTRNNNQDTNKFQISNFKIIHWELIFGDYLYLVSCILFLVASPIAIFYAKSTGALIGILAGIFVLLLLYKKTRAASIIILISGILTLTLLPTSNPIKQELFFQDRSGQIRVAIYKETLQLLKDRPLLGAGLASYAKRIEPYHTTVNGEGIEIFHHPHNIFLTMWVNTGIVGLAGFILILVWFFKEGFSHITYHITHNKNTNNEPMVRGMWYVVCVLSSMTVILISGLVDSPYIKNDLAVLFWLFPAIMFISIQSPKSESP